MINFWPRLFKMSIPYPFNNWGLTSPRRPMGGLLGQEKRRRKFSRTRALGILLLTNQFHDLFECLSVTEHKKQFCAQSVASIYRAAFVIFLYEGGWSLTEDYRKPDFTFGKMLSKPDHLIANSLAGTKTFTFNSRSMVLSCPTAQCNAVLFLSSSHVTSAPLSNKRDTTAGQPWAAAKSSGVHFSRSRGFKSTPWKR